MSVFKSRFRVLTQELRKSERRDLGEHPKDGAIRGGIGVSEVVGDAEARDEAATRSHPRLDEREPSNPAPRADLLGLTPYGIWEELAASGISGAVQLWVEVDGIKCV
jgi:hypothetical protein